MLTLNAPHRHRHGGRIFKPVECGRNGNPPPFDYQRRIDTLAPAAKRSNRYRHDYLEILGERLANGDITTRAFVVGNVIARTSNNHGKDVSFSHAFFATMIRNDNGNNVRSKYIGRGIHELFHAGLIDYQHGSEADRYDQDRRRRLGGRWQGPCTYRITIPDADETRLQARRQQSRRQQRQAKADTNTGQSGPPALTGHQQAVLGTVAELVAAHSTFQQAADALSREYTNPRDYEYGWAELNAIWRT